MRHRWLRVFGLCTLALISATPVSAQTTEFFNVGAFQAAAGQPVQVIGFDELPSQDGGPILTAYQSSGLTIRNRDNVGINVVRNLLLPYGSNFVTPGIMNSAPNAISSGFKAATAIPTLSDNLDFDFSTTTRAAGLFIGSLGGGGCELTATVVEFRDASGNLIAEESINRDHAGVIPTTFIPASTYWWDNRIFYGVISATPIARIRVINGPDGCDVISFDDVQFVPTPTAHPITIDPGSYTGEYLILQNQFSGSGAANLSLVPGTYSFDNSSGGRFSFDVTSTGSIANITNSDAAYASGNVLHLNSVDIHVDPQQYRGEYLLLGQCCSTGAQTFRVVPNLPVYFDNFSGGRFAFHVGSNGTISAIGNEVAAFAVGDMLILNNVSISVDPQAYVGWYQLLGHCCASGPSSFVVIPNLQVYFDNFAGDRFSFFVSETGALSLVSNPGAATPVGSSLVLNNSCVQVDPGQYMGAYVVQGQQAAGVGIARFALVTNTSYYILGSNTLFLVTPNGPMPNALEATISHELHAFSLSGGTCDSEPPTSVATSAANLNEWQATASVGVQISAEDTGDSGVKGIYVEQSGATVAASQLISGSSTTVEVFNEGLTNISYFAVDNAGNEEAVKVVTVKIDRSGPSVQCDPAPTGWNGANVSVSCTAEDPYSGIQGSPTFQLITNVASGVEMSSAQTGTHSVCDIAGNCGEGGPIQGIQIDRLAPAITITSPAGHYVVNQPVFAAYSCVDGGSGAIGCSGPVAAGQAINTGSAGTHQFSVTASDAVGNAAQANVEYTVGFGGRTLHDDTRPVKSGSTIPLRIQLIDGSGLNVSSAAIPVTAAGLSLVSTDISGTLQDAGSANPDNNFRYSNGEYIFNLKTTGLTTGRWRVGYRAVGDPVVHYAFFQVR